MTVLKKDSDRNVAIAICVMVVLNILSLALYSVQWYRTGSVITSSGQKAQGYHELPAVIAFVAFLHQVLGPSPKKQWHSIIGKLGIIATIICLAMATKNLQSGIVKQFHWSGEQVLPKVIPDPILRHLVLIWNETVNIHQFMLYGPLLVNQLWSGYQSAKQKRIADHESHMGAAMMFLLGPLAQRFLFNHILGSRDDWAVVAQVSTYSTLIMVLSMSEVTRPSLRVTLAGALALAVGTVHHNTSALVYLLAAAGGSSH